MLHNLVDQHSSALGFASFLSNCKKTAVQMINTLNWTRATWDFEEDIPRSMARSTSAHYASILPFLLLIFFIHSLPIVSCYCHQPYITPGLEPPTGQTPGIQPSQLEFPCVFHNHIPCCSSAFSFLSTEILWDQRLASEDNFKLFSGFWGCLKEGWMGTWGSKVNEEQEPHACS